MDARSPIDRARARVEAWAEARARVEIARARRGDDAPDETRAASTARRALGSGELRQDLEEASSLGLLTPDEHGALLAHLALAAREEVLARREVVALRTTRSVVVEGAPRTIAELIRTAVDEPHAHARAAALASIGRADDDDRARRLEAQGEAAAIGERVRARGPRAIDEDPGELDARAARFLEQTDDAAREALARAAHAHAALPPRTVQDVLVLLRAPRIDPLAPRRDRPRRLAAPLAPLGMGEALASRVHLDAPHDGVDPEARVIALDPPRRIVILPSSIELGLGSELALARAIGRALGASLVAPALPPALRRSWPGSIARGIGELLAHVHGDALFVGRARALDGAALETYRRAALAITLLRARALAARVRTERSGGQGRIERGAAELARALAVDDPTMPDALADPGTVRPEERRAELRAAMAAPSIALALRDRFDEDWFRNPRAAEPLRAACARGGALSIEAWCEELGASPDGTARRIADLVR